ncbi:MAG: type IX secretion system protein PorQ [Bacteroidota bacterium]|nr:type IX secretion system protein PorQ [Bacteroidota bacterium]
MVFRKVITSIVLVIVFFSCFSQTGGLTTYSFLNLPVPARTAALAGNTIGLKDDDVNLVAQNPASLNGGMSNQLSLSYINYIADINYLYATYAHSFDSIGNFAASIQNVGYGKFKETDEYGAEIGTFRANDYNFALSYAYDMDSMFTCGVSVKTIFSKYYTYSSLGNALDAGLTYRNKKKQFVASIVLNNFGYQWRTYSGAEKEKLPAYFNIGISKKVAKAPFRLLLSYENMNKWDLTYSDPNNPEPTVDPFTKEPIKKSKFRTGGDRLLRHLVVGTEVILSKNFNLRVGYNYRRRKEMTLPDKGGLVGFSMGLGFKISKFQFSYAFSKYHAAGNVNHFTVTTNLGSFVKQNK